MKTREADGAEGNRQAEGSRRPGWGLQDTETGSGPGRVRLITGKSKR